MSHKGQLSQRTRNSTNLASFCDFHRRSFQVRSAEWRALWLESTFPGRQLPDQSLSKRLLASPDCRMMLSNVPRVTGSCRGTGTVIVVPSMRFCMSLWLPRWRANTKSCCSRISHTSEPERTRSLPNRHLDLGYEYYSVKSPGNLGRRCGFKA